MTTDRMNGSLFQPSTVVPSPNPMVSLRKISNAWLSRDPRTPIEVQISSSLENFRARNPQHYDPNLSKESHHQRVQYLHKAESAGKSVNFEEGGKNEDNFRTRQLEMIPEKQEVRLSKRNENAKKRPNDI